MKHFALSVLALLVACAAFIGYNSSTTLCEAASPTPTVYGSGYQDCNACFSGTCAFCTASGKAIDGSPCKICRGTHRCFLCNGASRLPAGVRQPQIGFVSCPCFSGSCPVCGMVDAKPTCSICRGTGYCNRCQGSGQRLVVNGRVI